MLNITLSVFLIITLFLVFEGFRTGLVSKAISLVLLFLLSVIVVIAATYLNVHLSGSTMNIIVGGILLLVLLTLHRVMNVIYVDNKLMKKLGQPNILLRILGALIGVLEGALILWTVYGMMNCLNMGEVSARIELETVNTPVLQWLYDFNLIEMLVKALPLA